MKKFATMFLALLCFLAVKAQTTLVNEGFEVIPHSFSSSLTGGVPDWDTTKALKYAGTNSLRGKVTTKSINFVTTAKFKTAGYSKVYLRFKHICRISVAKKASILCRVGGSSNWLNVSKTDTTYLTNLQSGDLGFLISNAFNTSSYTQWKPNDANAVPTDSWWKNELFDLSYLIANKDTAQIQFKIETLGSQPNSYDYGWLIDNIEIIGSNTEITPPVIVLQPTILQDTIIGTGPWTIRAKITDASAISNANLIYSTERLGVNAGPFTVPMTAGAGNIYSADIPSMPYSTKVTYHITAQDQLGNGDETTPLKFFNKKLKLILVASDTISSVNTPNPFQQSWTQSKTQFIIKASELQSFGLRAGEISSIAFYLNSICNPTNLGNLFNKFTIQIAPTSINETTNAFEPAAFTTVYTAPNLIGNHTIGWNTFNFSTPFNWDGTSNLIIQTCFNNYNGTANYSQESAYIRQSVMGYNASTSAWTDGTVPDICSATGGFSISANNKRPVVRFGCTMIDLALDAGINDIIQPITGIMYNNTSDIRVRIVNGGTTNLTSAAINWSVDGILQTPSNWTGSLFEDQVSPDITLASGYNFSNGSHVVKVWISNPNNGTDLNPQNDTLNVSFFVCGGFLATGTYTVGGQSPDFATLDDVKTKLNVCGISGPVVFDLRPGTYNTSLELKNIIGGSNTNTVTIKSENNNAASVVILDALNNNATLVLDSVSHFRLKHVTLKTTAKNKNRLVWLKNNCSDIQFVSNVFEGIDTNLAVPDFALVYFEKDIYQKDSSLLFDGNIFKNGSYGMFLKGDPYKSTIGITIINNNFQGQAYCGLLMSDCDQYSVTNNSFSQNQNSDQEFKGLFFSYCGDGKSVSYNKVLSKKLKNGIFFEYCKGSSKSPMMVVNNYVASSATYSSLYDYSNGINFGGSSSDSLYANVFYNTVNLNGDAPKSNALRISGLSGFNVRNNNLVNNATGSAYTISQAPANWLSNYNNLFSNGIAVATYDGSPKSNLISWKDATGKDTNSLSLNTSFTSFDNFHMFEIGLNGKAQPIANITTDIENQVRNATTPDIGCDEFDVIPINLSISSIAKPQNVTPCGANGLTLQVKVKSVGSAPINFASNNAVIKALVTGPIAQSYTLTLDTGTLASGSSWDVNITNLLDFSNMGTYNVKIYSTIAADTIRINDTLVSSYSFVKINSYPYDVDFSSQPNPAWSISQLSGTTSWQYVQGDMNNPLLSPSYGTGRLFLDAYSSSYSTSRAKTPVFDFTGISHPYLEFWMSQDASSQGTSNLGVTVRISSDGGATWNSDTLFASRYNGSFTKPGWKLFNKHLTNYAGMPCVIIAFDGTNGNYGKNFSIDRVVVRNLYNNDLKTNIVYSKGKLPVQYGTPDQVGVIIENNGAATQYNKLLTVELTGNNTQTLTYTIDSIQPGDLKTVYLQGLTPANTGTNTVTAFLPSDDINSNNAQSYRMETTSNAFSYADTSASAISVGSGNGLLLSKFKVNGTRSVMSVKAYLQGDLTLNKVIYGVVLNNAGVVVARSINDTIKVNENNQWRTFSFPNWHDAIFTDTTFYVGIAQIGTNYSPLGAQKEIPVRPNTFYLCNSLTGGPLVETIANGRFMIEAEIGSLPSYDAVLQSVANPTSGCGIGSQAVTLNIKNNGINNIAANEITASYSVNNGAVVTLPVNVAINSGSSFNFAFPSVDFSASSNNTTYAIKAWIKHNSDAINTNDTIKNWVVVSKPIPSKPTITSGNPASVTYDASVTITAQNPGGNFGYLNWFPTNESISSLGTANSFTSGTLHSDTSFFVLFQKIDKYGVPVGTGTDESKYVPFYDDNDYSWSSSLYKKWEIQDVGTIDTIWLDIKNVSEQGVFEAQKIYLSMISDSLFSNTNYISTSGMTLVYDGNLKLTTPGWLAIPLKTPFNYTGNGNLLMHWLNLDGAVIDNPIISFNSTQLYYLSKYNESYDAIDTTSIGKMYPMRPNVRFYNPEIGCQSPREKVLVDVINIPSVEVQPLSVTSPVTDCALHQENISVTVKNNLQSTTPVGTPIYCLVNGTTLLQDTIDVAINVGETIPFTFSQPYDFTALTATNPYTLKVWTKAIGDTYTANDTLVYTFISKWTTTDLTLSNLTIPYGTSHSFVYPDWLTVYADAGASDQIYFGNNFTTPILYDTTSYWMQAVQVNGTRFNATLGTGDKTQKNVPFHSNYDFSWSAALYQKSELVGVGTIDTVWLEISSSTVTGLLTNQKMYLGVVNDTKFTSAAQPNRNNMTLVYDGSLMIPASGWIGIPLTESFTYDGGGSLMMYWENREGSYIGNPGPYFRSSQIDSASIYIVQDGSFPDNQEGTIFSHRPNIRLTGLNKSCPSPLKKIVISVSGTPSKDAGVIRFNGPFGGSFLSTTEHVSVTVKNYGTDPISNFSISYKIGAEPPVTETYTGSLASMDTLVYVFATNQDFSSMSQNINLKAYTRLLGDNYPTNDTIEGTVAVPNYCIPSIINPVSFMDIGNITFAGINNGIAYPLYYNAEACKGYTDFTQTVAPAYLAKGGNYQFRATQINNANFASVATAKVYIDLNRNGSFEAGETVYTNHSSSDEGSGLTFDQLTTTGNITIPVDAPVGYTRMRVVFDDISNAPACDSYYYGETEDYTVMIYDATNPDVALTHFSSPSNPSGKEGDIQSIKVNLMNVGTTPITTATIKLIHNGTITTKTWSGNLASMSSVVDSITTVTLVAGENNFTAFVTLAGDNMHYNDTIHFVLNALARYDIKPVAILNPNGMSCPNSNENIVVRITNLGINTINFASNNLVLKTQVLINDVAEYQTIISSGTLAANGTKDITISGANFATGGAYKVRAIAVLTGDGITANDTLLTDTIKINPVVGTLPSIEDFESFTVGTAPFPNDWTSSSNSTTTTKYLWMANAGTTYSGAVAGPAVDHTLGNSSGKYVYVYGGYGANGDVTQLTSKCYNFVSVSGQSNSVSFYYHMFNPGTNAKLYVDYGSGSNWITLDSLIGQKQTTQSAAWAQKFVAVPNQNKNGRIRFRAQRGTTAGDIAIDDINYKRLLPDVGIATIVQPGAYPTDSVVANAPVSLKVRIHNYGLLPIDTVPVAYKVGANGIEVLETFIGSIPAGADYDYTFNTPYTAPTPRTHYVCSYTKLASDSDTLNNRSCRNVTVYTVGLEDFDVNQFSLSQNNPNPASNNTVIGFYMPHSGKVTFKVTDVIGKELYTEEIGATQGENMINLNTVNFAPGMYYYWVEFKDRRLSRKMNIIK